MIPENGNSPSSKKVENSNGVKPAGGSPQAGRPAVPKPPIAAPGISGAPVPSVPPLKSVQVPLVPRIPQPPAGGGGGAARPSAAAPPKRTYTVTPAVIAAHKASAANSTGPKTEAGKDRSSRNAVVHGLTARKASIVVDVADQPAYDASRDKARKEYPRVEGSETGELFLELLVQVKWKLLVHLPPAERGAVRHARQWHADGDRALLEQLQRRAAQDQHDDLVALRFTADGLEEVTKLMTAFAEDVRAHDAHSPELGKKVRAFAARLKGAAPELPALTGLEGKAEVLATIKRAIAEITAKAARMRVTEAQRRAIAHDMAFVPASPEMDKIMRYRAELRRELKFVLEQLAPYRRQQGDPAA
jgi:hypothetical protein